MSVAIVKARLAITTEKDGIFSIPGDLEKMRDTLVLSAQNYIILKVALDKLSGIDTLFLNKLAADSIPAEFIAKKDSLLNDFDRKDIVYYAGIHTETSLFEYLQLAQQFDVSQRGILLKSVVINRLAFMVNSDNGGLQFTRFRIRIYDLDTLTGGPGRDLCSQLIEIKNRERRQLRVNLTQYKIALPSRTFFVAIEWLRDFDNMGYSTVFDEKLWKEVKHVNYRPAIGISPLKGKKLNIWGLNMKREWKPYTYFSPDYTDLAIEATIAY
ncbi:MAG: hypothetical protein EOP48_09410 [Sphingobacteriales bacterium]|nr:MAG: hypothetical protein EOP48_09410 [Sphingobacteriales bacterium]